MSVHGKIFRSDPSTGRSPVVNSKKPKGAKTDMLHSVPVPREAHRTTNNRDSDRHRLPDQGARVTHKRKSHVVQLINLSGGGAMIAATDFEPMLWDRVDLHLGEGGTIEGAVRWLKADRIGLEFAHETELDCPADERAALLRTVIAENFPNAPLTAPKPVAAREEPAGQVEQPEVPGDEQRSQRRHPLIWSGVLHYDFESMPVRLRNISRTGALIESEAALAVGAEPLLDLGGAGSVFGTVAWIVGDQAGLRFHEPFDLNHLARSRPEIAPVKWERPAYMKPWAEEGSPWSEQWGRMSIDELRDELEGFLKH
jgi:hypothetical protein